ncbi:hypothetical protein CERSUDRAFT_150345 [Gelatoporia subvermispora B]|uniref:Glutamine amidotransferase type-2 domain-containing protein n=1 Tax=Ceriporiopsis subvermispora (strain B) TaxID=914234 RepID=M2RMJ5_CERS8|nr:hypothetical protein CERSUDRAFT_150345 [Gelatoporia subvermispora B]
MCRWFTYISNSEPQLLADVLIEPAHSLSKQVHDRYLPYLKHYEPDVDPADTKKEISTRNSPYNMDGLGIAWYSNTRAEFGEAQGPSPALYKILRQPLTDNIYTSICNNTSSQAIFGHIRAASPSSAITDYNCHPFQFGRWLFMHNGGLAFFNVVKRDMVTCMSDAALDLVKGTTDSEHLAALFFTFLEQDKGPAAWDATHPIADVKQALELAIAKVLEFQDAYVKRSGAAPQASSINIAITDGTQLLAIRFRNHATEHPPSLYYSTTAGITLNRKYPGHPDQEGADNGSANLKAPHEHGDHVIVASEPTTYKKHDWQLIPKNQCVMVPPDMQMQLVPVDVQF